MCSGRNESSGRDPRYGGLLGLAEGAAVVVRRRIIPLDGKTTELTDAYFPPAIARGTRLAETTKIPGGAVTLLAELGHVGDLVREEVSARMPDPAEQEALALAPNEPVLTRTRVTLDASGEPFQVDVSVFAAMAEFIQTIEG